MAVRINGQTFRSGCDIEILMASFNREAKITPEEKERRIALYTERAERGVDLFDGTEVSESQVIDDDI